MKTMIKSQPNDVDDIVKIDKEVTGNDSRREYIKEAVEAEQCIVVKNEVSIVGFLIYDTHFFDCSFISLVMVSTPQRRKGYATALLEYFIKLSPTQKIFSSTNKSNKKMQEVFIANGFVQSGVIENLDEGDPEIIYFRSK